MKINNNRWNRIRYTLYTPGYDWAAKILDSSRKKSIQELDVKPGDRVLIIGAGTGLDLVHLPSDCEIVATDLTPSMLDKAKKRNDKLKRNMQALVMDGQSLDFPDASFDKVILHLILAVIPDPYRCIKEAERVLKPGGSIAVYDKFVPKERKVSMGRRFANVFTNLFFSDITRDFESLLKTTNLKVVSDVDADFKGNFRLIKLMK